MTIVRAPLALLVAALLWLLAAPMSAGTQDAAAEECFAQTGYCVQGRFLDYWENNGGLALNGYPLTGEFVATLEDSQPYTVQYFERARLEYHPENQGTEYVVLLGLMGWETVKTGGWYR